MNYYSKLLFLLCAIFLSISESKILAEGSVMTNSSRFKIQIRQLDYSMPSEVQKNLESFMNEEQIKQIQEGAKAFHKAMANRISRGIEKELIRQSIPVVENDADMVITINVKEIEEITYLNEPIIEEVIVIGTIKDKEVLDISFRQHKDYIDFKFWRRIKTAEEIGRILGGKIAKQIKNLAIKN